MATRTGTVGCSPASTADSPPEPRHGTERPSENTVQRALGSLTLPLWQRLRCLNRCRYTTCHTSPDTTPSVKLFRAWLLVLLAVLLPVRGAMAVAMGCAPSGTPLPSQVTMVSGDDDHHGHHRADAGHGHASVAHDHASPDHSAGHDGPEDHGKAHSDKCNLCSASCSATPLVREVAGVPELNDPTSTVFPSLAAPAPSFVSDGQERPPRTI